MPRTFIIWFSLFFVSIMLSVFLHEIGHGVSAYLAGHPVSTGFNRVGDAGKKPSDPDFRGETDRYDNPWDLGPAVTLVAAVICTLLLARAEGHAAVWMIAALALSNAVLRLVPVLMSYLTLLLRGSFAVEDEIMQGMLWYEMTGVGTLKYLPSLISVVISLVCLYFIFSLLWIKAPGLYGTREFLYASVLALLAWLPVANFLDERLRIDWIP